MKSHAKSYFKNPRNSKIISSSIQLGLLAIAFLFYSCFNGNETSAAHPDYDQWRHYLGGPDRNHFSTLDQIHKENLDRLTVLWSYDAPDMGQMQMNPIIIDTLLYGVTADQKAIALHAATGKEVWRFEDEENSGHSANRGVSFYDDGNDGRIFFVTGPFLYALNAKTGKPINGFGKEGRIDLHIALPEKAADKFVTSTTPGTIYKNLIIMPVRVAENESSAPGNLVAIDCNSGELVWRFHTIPHPGESGYDSWKDKDAYKSDGIGGANNWAGMALDEARGMVYVPTGSVAPDFYGGARRGSNLYANCLLAMDAATGKLKWYFQFTHHDLWDRDLPAPPNLIEVVYNGAKIPAVAQITKQGYVFVFDRRTGKPLFDIEEVEVPPSSIPGEEAWPTQPIPTKPRPFARLSNDLTENDISPYAVNREELLERFRKMDRRQYAPPGLEPVLLLPGYDGGAEWGGAGADPQEGILYVNANEMAWILQLKEKSNVIDDSLPLGASIYSQYCASCHKPDLSGIPASGFPSLKNLNSKYTKPEVLNIIDKGKGMMPGFPQIPKEEKTMLLKFLFEVKEDKTEIVTKLENKPNLKGSLTYEHTGYFKFMDSNNLPAISPPWGTLHAIDLNTGDYKWSIPLGETESLKAAGHPTTGIENYGGPLLTKNGLLFIAATKDGYFRAFDKKNGTLLWEYKLPAPAFATPSTYMVNGKQYIVIACGGEKLGTEKGNKIIAFGIGN